MTILYNTRDEKGNDIVKEVQIKEYIPVKAKVTCGICQRSAEQGIPVKKIVSANFTDWAYVGEYVCEECSRLFSLYFYSYEVSPDGIKLFNAREASAQILGPHKAPFRIIITKSRKKHLFYRSVLNYKDDAFCINLEDEQILTTKQRMQELFDFVECMMALGQSKMQMADGELSMQVATKVGLNALLYLRKEIETSREIQIPLFCGQARNVSEEEAIECISILTRMI